MLYLGLKYWLSKEEVNVLIIFNFLNSAFSSSSNLPSPFSSNFDSSSVNGSKIGFIF